MIVQRQVTEPRDMCRVCMYTLYYRIQSVCRYYLPRYIPIVQLLSRRVLNQWVRIPNYLVIIYFHISD